MLNQRFKTKTNMARELNVEWRTIQKTFSQQERNTSKGGSIVLEKILGYCAQNNISIDEVITMYIVHMTQGDNDLHFFYDA